MISTEVIPPGWVRHEDLLQWWQILAEVDEEFVPPLSRRRDTTSPIRSASSDANGFCVGDAGAYQQSVIQQWTLFARDGQEVVGAMSYIPTYWIAHLRPWMPCTYLSTLVVPSTYRRKGVARR